MYQLLVYAHILAAVVWVGGAAFMQLLAFRVQRADDPTEVPQLARHFEALGRRVFLPAAFVIILTGLVMTIQAWSFGQLWILVAIGLWLLSAFLGAVFLGPGAKRAAAAFDAEGPTSARGRQELGRLSLVSRLELVSFAIIIALMVFKPGS